MNKTIKPLLIDYSLSFIKYAIQKMMLAFLLLISITINSYATKYVSFDFDEYSSNSNITATFTEQPRDLDRTENAYFKECNLFIAYMLTNGIEEFNSDIEGLISGYNALEAVVHPLVDPSHMWGSSPILRLEDKCDELIEELLKTNRYKISISMLIDVSYNLNYKIFELLLPYVDYPLFIEMEEESTLLAHSSITPLHAAIDGFLGIILLGNETLEDRLQEKLREVENQLQEKLRELYKEIIFLVEDKCTESDINKSEEQLNAVLDKITEFSKYLNGVIEEHIDEDEPEDDELEEDGFKQEIVDFFDLFFTRLKKDVRRVYNNRKELYQRSINALNLPAEVIHIITTYDPCFEYNKKAVKRKIDAISSSSPSLSSNQQPDGSTHSTTSSNSTSSDSSSSNNAHEPYHQVPENSEDGDQGNNKGFQHTTMPPFQAFINNLWAKIRPEISSYDDLERYIMQLEKMLTDQELSPTVKKAINELLKFLNRVKNNNTLVPLDLGHPEIDPNRIKPLSIGDMLRKGSELRFNPICYSR